MKIAIATCIKQPELHEQDRPLIPLFAEVGVIAEPVIWNASEIDWSQYNGVIIRSPWDYHLNQQAFTTWLKYLQAKGIATLNAVSVALKNQHKFYLQELQQKGIEIIPTVFLKSGELDLSVVISNHWEKAVIKPAVSGGGYRTELFHKNEIASITDTYKDFAAYNDLLLQPFLPEIQELGEVSLVFLNKQYSHAVIKHPKKGDFRVQWDFGGTFKNYEPETAIIHQAEQILSLIDEDLLYARVDGLVKEGRFILMELELLEPYLFFEVHSPSRKKFVDDAVKLLK